MPANGCEFICRRIEEIRQESAFLNEACGHDAASSLRGLRGGSWFNGSLSASYRGNLDPASGGLLSHIGFRVASIPEPSSHMLGLLGMLGLLLRRRGAS